MPLQVGTFGAVATAVNIWEATSGAIMVDISCSVTSDGYQGEAITASQCLVQKDGTVSTITHETLRAVFAWDGVDPFWLCEPENLSEKPFEIVLDNETYEGKTRLKVKYVNALGSTRHQPADRKSILAKYGAKFRALSGGVPAKAPAAAPAPKPAAPPPPSKTCAAPPEPKVTLEDAWASCCENNLGKSREELTAIWNDATERIGKPADQFTSMDWLKVSRSFDNVPV